MAETAKRKNQQVRWIALLAVTLVALYLCWLMLQPFVEVLLWALVLVIVFSPVHRRIQGRLKSPGWSALVSCVLVIVTILVPLTLVTLAVVKEVSGVAKNLQANADSLLDPNSPTTGPILRWLDQYVDIVQTNPAEGAPAPPEGEAAAPAPAGENSQTPEQENSTSPQQYLAERIKGMSGVIAGRTVSFLGGVVGVVIETFFVIFTMYYLFRDGERLRAGLRYALPLDSARSGEIFQRTHDVISASVYGVLVIATIQGTLGGLAFWALGIPSPLLWGVVMVFLSMIPMAGAFIVWVPAALYLLATGEWGKALALALWGALAIGTVDNFLRPKLVGERTRLHELIIFFSVLGGLQVFGVLGLVLGPVVVAITLALLDILRHADPAQGGEPGQTLLETQEDLRDVPDDDAKSREPLPAATPTESPSV